MALAHWLSRWEPCTPRIDRDWLLFQAGRAWAEAKGKRTDPLVPADAVMPESNAQSAPAKGVRHAKVPSWLWPAATGFWAAVALVLALLLVRRPAIAPTIASDPPPSFEHRSAVTTTDRPEHSVIRGHAGAGLPALAEASLPGASDPGPQRQTVIGESSSFDACAVFWGKILNEERLPRWFRERERLLRLGMEAWDVEGFRCPSIEGTVKPTGAPAVGRFPEEDKPSHPVASLRGWGGGMEMDWLVEEPLRLRPEPMPSPLSGWWSMLWRGTGGTGGDPL